MILRSEVVLCVTDIRPKVEGLRLRPVPATHVGVATKSKQTDASAHADGRMDCNESGTHTAFTIQPDCFACGIRKEELREGPRSCATASPRRRDVACELDRFPPERVLRRARTATLLVEVESGPRLVVERYPPAPRAERAAFNERITELRSECTELRNP